MNELKMGDIVEVRDCTQEWSDRIFIKYGKPGQIMYVNPDYAQNFRDNENFSTFTIDDRGWRVKQKPEYVPFTWDDREQLRGKWIRSKILQHLEYCILDITSISIHVYEVQSISFEKLLDSYEFIDGTPCGKLKKND